MADIYWGLGVIGALSAAVFLVTLAAGRRLPGLACDVAALLVVAAIFAYIRFFWYSTRLASFLPFSNLVIVGNWFPLAAGALGGLAWHRVSGRFLRKAVFVGAVTGASLYSVCYPLLGQLPRCENVWWSDVCLQTTTKTCTPACAATLLQCYGIAATEREMAELCLTRDGTTWMGLYRGLKLKTSGTPWDVEVLSCDANQLLGRHDGPMILSVGLPTGKLNEHIRLAEWGWKRGIGHSVIWLGRQSNGRLLIADPTPSVGREEWTRGDIHYLYRGTALRLVKRS